MTKPDLSVVIIDCSRFDEATVAIDKVEARLADQKLVGFYGHDGDEEHHLPEWVAPIAWDHTVPRKGIWKTQMFADRNNACRLSQELTVALVAAAFRLES